MKIMVNGNAYEFENGKNALDIAGEIDKELKKKRCQQRTNSFQINRPPRWILCEADDKYTKRSLRGVHGGFQSVQLKLPFAADTSSITRSTKISDNKKTTHRVESGEV